MARAVPPHGLLDLYWAKRQNNLTSFSNKDDFVSFVSGMEDPQVFENMAKSVYEMYPQVDQEVIDEQTGMTQYREDSERGWIGNVGRGMADRAFDLAGGLVESLDILQQSVGGFDENAISDLAEHLREQDFGYEEWTTWDDVKRDPWKVFAFAMEKGLVSIPDMAMVMGGPLGMGAYITARTGEIANERAINNNLKQATGLDAMAALPAAALSAYLDRLGARAILGIGKKVKANKATAKAEVDQHREMVEKMFPHLPKKAGVKAWAGAVGGAAAKEMATEAAQETIEYTGATAGTERGFDVAEAGESALIGGVVGGIFGGTVRGATAAGQQAMGKTQEGMTEAVKERMEAEKNKKVTDDKGKQDMSERHLSNVELHEEVKKGTRSIIATNALADGMKVIVSPHGAEAVKGTVIQNEKDENLFDIIGDDGQPLMTGVSKNHEFVDADVFTQNEIDVQEDIDPEFESYKTELGRVVLRQTDTVTEAGIDALKSLRKDKRFEFLDEDTKNQVDDLIDAFEKTQDDDTDTTGTPPPTTPEEEEWNRTPELIRTAAERLEQQEVYDPESPDIAKDISLAEDFLEASERLGLAPESVTKRIRTAVDELKKRTKPVEPPPPPPPDDTDTDTEEDTTLPEAFEADTALVESIAETGLTLDNEVQMDEAYQRLVKGTLAEEWNDLTDAQQGRIHKAIKAYRDNVKESRTELSIGVGAAIRNIEKTMSTGQPGPNYVDTIKAIEDPLTKADRLSEARELKDLVESKDFDINRVPYKWRQRLMDAYEHVKDANLDDDTDTDTDTDTETEEDKVNNIQWFIEGAFPQKAKTDDMNYRSEVQSLARELVEKGYDTDEKAYAYIKKIVGKKRKLDWVDLQSVRQALAKEKEGDTDTDTDTEGDTDTDTEGDADPVEEPKFLWSHIFNKGFAETWTSMGNKELLKKLDEVIETARGNQYSGHLFESKRTTGMIYVIAKQRKINVKQRETSALANLYKKYKDAKTDDLVKIAEANILKLTGTKNLNKIADNVKNYQSKLKERLDSSDPEVAKEANKELKEWGDLGLETGVVIGILFQRNAHIDKDTDTDTDTEGDTTPEPKTLEELLPEKVYQAYQKIIEQDANDIDEADYQTLSDFVKSDEFNALSEDNRKLLQSALAKVEANRKDPDPVLEIPGEVADAMGLLNRMLVITERLQNEKLRRPDIPRALEKVKPQIKVIEDYIASPEYDNLIDEKKTEIKELLDRISALTKKPRGAGRPSDLTIEVDSALDAIREAGRKTEGDKPSTGKAIKPSVEAISLFINNVNLTDLSPAVTERLNEALATLKRWGITIDLDGGDVTDAWGLLSNNKPDKDPDDGDVNVPNVWGKEELEGENVFLNELREADKTSKDQIVSSMDISLWRTNEVKRDLKKTGRVSVSEVLKFIQENLELSLLQAWSKVQLEAGRLNLAMVPRKFKTETNRAHVKRLYKRYMEMPLDDLIAEKNRLSKLGQELIDQKEDHSLVAVFHQDEDVSALYLTEAAIDEAIDRQTDKELIRKVVNATENEQGRLEDLVGQFKRAAVVDARQVIALENLTFKGGTMLGEAVKGESTVWTPQMGSILVTYLSADPSLKFLQPQQRATFRKAFSLLQKYNSPLTSGLSISKDKSLPEQKHEALTTLENIGHEIGMAYAVLYERAPPQISAEVTRREAEKTAREVIEANSRGAETRPNPSIVDRVVDLLVNKGIASEGKPGINNWSGTNFFDDDITVIDGNTVMELQRRLEALPDATEPEGDMASQLPETALDPELESRDVGITEDEIREKLNEVNATEDQIRIALRAREIESQMSDSWIKKRFNFFQPQNFDYSQPQTGTYTNIRDLINKYLDARLHQYRLIKMPDPEGFDRLHDGKTPEELALEDVMEKLNQETMNRLEDILLEAQLFFPLESVAGMHAMNEIDRNMEEAIKNIFGNILPDEEVNIEVTDKTGRTSSGFFRRPYLDYKAMAFVSKDNNVVETEHVNPRFGGAESGGLNYELAYIQTAAHEIFHYMKHTGRITAEEWNILVEAAKEGNLLDKYQVITRWGRAYSKWKRKDEAFIEETMAESLGYMVYDLYTEALENNVNDVSQLAAMKLVPKKYREQVAKILQKVFDAVKKLAERYRLDEKQRKNASYQDLANEIYADIIMGNVGKRKPRQGYQDFQTWWSMIDILRNMRKDHPYATKRRDTHFKEVKVNSKAKARLARDRWTRDVRDSLHNWINHALEYGDKIEKWQNEEEAIQDIDLILGKYNHWPDQPEMAQPFVEKNLKTTTADELASALKAVLGSVGLDNFKSFLEFVKRQPMGKQAESWYPGDPEQALTPEAAASREEAIAKFDRQNPQPEQQSMPENYQPFAELLNEERTEQLMELDSLFNDFLSIEKNYEGREISNPMALLSEREEQSGYSVEPAENMLGQTQEQIDEGEDLDDALDELDDQISSAIDVLEEVIAELKADSKVQKVHDDINLYIKKKFTDAGFKVINADRINSHWNIEKLDAEGEVVYGAKIRIKDHAWSEGAGSHYGHSSPDFEYDYSGGEPSYAELKKFIDSTLEQAIDEAEESDAPVMYSVAPGVEARIRSVEEPVGEPEPESPITDEERLHTFDNEETERRFRQAQKGLEEPNLKERAKGWLEEIKQYLRHFKYIKRTEYDAQIIEQLRHLEGSNGYAVSMIESEMNKIQKALKSPQDFDLFERAVVIRDLSWNTDMDMPFGLTAETLAGELSRLEAAVEANPQVKKALSIRDAHMEKIRRQMIDHGVLEESRLQNIHYFRRQVLEYAQLMKAGGPGGNGKITTPFFHGRKGSELDINADYFQVETEYLAQAYQSIRAQQFINWLRKSKYNRKPKYREKAKQHNASAYNDALLADFRKGIELMPEGMREVFSQIAGSSKDFKQVSKMLTAFLYRKGNKKTKEAWDTMVENGHFQEVVQFRDNIRRTVIAMSSLDREASLISKILNAVDNNENITDPEQFLEDIGYREMPPKVRQFFRGKLSLDTESVGPSADIFQVSSWLASRPEKLLQDASIAAKMLLKAVGNKNSHTRKLVGDVFIDPNNDKQLIKAYGEEGEASWQPDARSGNERAIHVFLEKSVSEHVFDKVTSQVFGAFAAQIAEKGEQWQAVRDIIEESSNTHRVLGNLKESFIVPDYLANQMNEFRDRRMEHIVARASYDIQKHFKKFMLLGPWRVIKYSLNNITGDLDALIGTKGGSGTVRHIKPALKEMFDYLYRGQPPSARLQEALKMDIVNSSMTMQEIPAKALLEMERTGKVDFKTLFPGRVEKKGGTLSRAMQMPGKAYSKYFETVGRVVALREQGVRYAAYLHYHEQLVVKGKTPDQIGYGATPLKIIRGLEGDSVTLAGRMARDMFGDYGNLSVTGRYARNHFIMFWSWAESNLKRYAHLFSNTYNYAMYTGRTDGIPAGMIMAATLMFKISAFYGALMFYSHILMGDDDEYLDDDSWQMKVRIPSPVKGEVWDMRIQGALSDVLGWLNMEDVGSIYNAHQRGLADMSDIVKTIAQAPANRLIQGLNPMIKVPIELVSGKSFFPDVFNPLSIRDPYEHVSRIWSFHREYQAISKAVGRPVPARDYFSLKNFMSLLVYRKDRAEMAYDQIRNMAFQFKKLQMDQQDKTRLLRNLQRAKRYGDVETARNIQRILIQSYGYNMKNFNRLQRSKNPLASLNKNEKIRFIAGLSPIERHTLRIANTYHHKTFATQ